MKRMFRSWLYSLLVLGCAGQAAKRARGILVELEDAKLAGRDYDVGLLLALRQVPHMLQVLGLQAAGVPMGA